METGRSEITTIDHVIDELGRIVGECEKHHDPCGYFAALYQKVTIRVKEGILNGYFDDGARMAELDVIFALRYIDAYYAWKRNGEITASWQRVFESSIRYWPVVFQHLLLGMNAHINLDLAIAAAEVSKGKNIQHLKKDFVRINEILSSLVVDVQQNLSAIWPTLTKILRLSGKVDDFMVDFSMKLARNGAWRHACLLAECKPDDLHNLMLERDKKVSRKANLITGPGFIGTLVFSIIRLGERGSVAEKIAHLKYKILKEKTPATASVQSRR
ncbi:MAG: DUF5995 family protein [Bacteroidota bacterium]